MTETNFSGTSKSSLADHSQIDGPKPEVPGRDTAAYLTAANRISELTKSMTVIEPGKVFGRKRKLAEKEVADITLVIANLGEGFLRPGYLEDARDLFDRLCNFQYWYGESPEHKQLEQVAIRTIDHYLPTIKDHIVGDNLPTSASLFDLIGQLGKDTDDDVRLRVAEAILQKKEIFATLLKNKDLRSEVKEVLETVISIGSPKQNQEFFEIVDESLRVGDKEYQTSFLADLLDSEHQMVRLFAEHLIVSILDERFHLPGEKFIQEWKSSCGKANSFRHNINSNIRTIEVVEDKYPQGALRLYKDFGIVNFGRYPDEILLAQVEQIDKTDKPYGVIIYPRGDWNGAFHQDVLLLGGFSKEVGERNYVRAYESGSQRELAETFIKSNQKYGKISFAIIGGHGTQDSIHFGNKGRGGRLYATDIVNYVGDAGDGEDIGWAKVPRPVAMKTKKFFVDDPKIVLLSCSTGGGDEGGIAEKISRLGATVTAPDKDSSLSYIGAIFEEEKLTNIDIIYGGATAKTFRNGVDITNK